MFVRLLIFTWAALALVGVARASEEEFLPWSEVRIVMAERKETGQVVFTAKMAGDKFGQIDIEAFGKQHKAEKEHLEKLNGFPLSSLVTTHEAGYERLGGHTIHFKLRTIQYDAAGRLIEKNVVLSLSHGKGLEVSGPRERVLKEKKLTGWPAHAAPSAERKTSAERSNTLAYSICAYEARQKWGARLP